MLNLRCPLCRQSASQELFERITGIWRERRVQEKLLREKQKELLKQQREDRKQLEAERKRLKAEQRVVIDKKVADQTKKFTLQISKIEAQRDKIKEQSEKKIARAIRVAERKASVAVRKDLRAKFKESVRLAVEEAGSRAQQTIESTRKQMGTLRAQNLKQQDRIKNLEVQLRNQTTPQLEGLLYEDQLMAALKRDFPVDRLSHTGKGGDILQQIIFDDEERGLIVYECKKVSHWQSAHVEQAAAAKLQRKADYAILVTNAPRKGSGALFIEKGVVVINPGGVLAISGILRDQIIRVAQLKLTHAQKEEAIEKTLQYLQGAEFKNALEVVVRKTVEMYDDLRKECQDHIKIWRKRHDCLKSVYVSTTQVRTTTARLVSGKTEETAQPFPALPNLTELS